MISLSQRFNRFDTYVFVLIASLAAGNLFGAMQLPRVLALLMLPSCMLNWPSNYELSRYRLISVVFIGFGLVSCFWSPAGLKEGLIAVSYNAVHLALFFEIIVFSTRANDPLRAITTGALFAVFCSSVVAFWEISTDQHLSTSKLDEAISRNIGADSYVRYFTAATFYNFNTYVTFLCFLLPFIFWGMSNSDYGRKMRIVSLIALVILVVLVLYNGSRGGLLSIVVAFIIYLCHIFFVRRRFSFWIIIMAVALGGVLYYYGSTVLSTLLLRQSLQGSISDEPRLIVWSNAWKVISEYCFVGCGAGGLEYAMSRYAHGGITAAHNVFLEIFAEYGIVFCILLMLFLFKLLRRVKYIADSSRRVCLYQALITFPIVGIINSGYLTQPVLWASLASFYMFANYEQVRPTGESI